MLPLWSSDANHSVQVVQWTRWEDRQEVDALIGLFEDIAFVEGWEPGEALRLWQERSLYFALHVRGALAGGLQLVLPDQGKSLKAPSLSPVLPFQSLWPEVPVFTDTGSHHLYYRSAHVTVLVLEAAVRGEGLLFWNVVIEMWRYCVGQGITTLFLEVTPRVLPLYQRLGWPLTICGELRRHWGEDCYLCTLGIPEVAEAILRRSERSPYYREIIAQAFRVRVAMPETKPSSSDAAMHRHSATSIVREPGARYSYTSVSVSTGSSRAWPITATQALQKHPQYPDHSQYSQHHQHL